jgi:hypothetical protein
VASAKPTEPLRGPLLPAVRRGGHQQEVSGAGTEFFPKDKAPGLFKFGTKENPML